MVHQGACGGGEDLGRVLSALEDPPRELLDAKQRPHYTKSQCCEVVNLRLSGVIP